MPQNYYEEGLRPWTAASANISQAMLGLPQLRARVNQQRQQDAELSAVRQAQARNYDAETGKISEDTKRLARIGLATERLGTNAPALVRAFESGDFSNPVLDTAVGDMAVITGENKDDLAALVRSLASAGIVSRGGPNPSAGVVRQAGALANPASIANKDADAAASMANAGTAAASREAVARTALQRRSTPQADVEQIRYLYRQLGKVEDAIMSSEQAGDASITGTKNRRGLRQQAEAIRRQIAGLRGGNADMPMANQEQDPDDSEAALPALPVPATPTAAPNAPAAGPVAQQPTYSDTLLAEANDAIRRGADPVKVKARLAQMGIQVQ